MENPRSFSQAMTPVAGLKIMPWKIRPVTATARIRGRKMMVWTTTRERGAIRSAAAMTRAMQTARSGRSPSR